MKTPTGTRTNRSPQGRKNLFAKAGAAVKKRRAANAARDTKANRSAGRRLANDPKAGKGGDAHHESKAKAAPRKPLPKLSSDNKTMGQGPNKSAAKAKPKKSGKYKPEVRLEVQKQNSKTKKRVGTEPAPKKKAPAPKKPAPKKEKKSVKTARKKARKAYKRTSKKGTPKKMQTQKFLNRHLG